MSIALFHLIVAAHYMECLSPGSLLQVRERLFSLRISEMKLRQDGMMAINKLVPEMKDYSVGVQPDWEAFLVAEQSMIVNISGRGILLILPAGEY